MKRVIGIALLLTSIVAAVGPPGRAQTSKKASEVEGEVRQVFDKWSTALTRGDKKTYLDTFWNSPRLVIRVAGGEWIGFATRLRRHVV